MGARESDGARCRTTRSIYKTSRDQHYPRPKLDESESEETSDHSNPNNQYGLRLPPLAKRHPRYERLLVPTTAAQRKPLAMQ